MSTTSTELLEAIQTNQQQTQELISTLSRLGATRWQLFKRVVPWLAVVSVELSMHIAAQPWWRGDIGSTVNNIESSLLTWAGSDAIYSNNMKVGDKVAGYTITSAFGPRTAPKLTNGGRGSSDHKAVDLDTPVGVQLYMIGTGPGTVECREHSGGWGKHAVISPSGISFTFQAAHLQNCRSGTFQPGEIYGTTGKSGGITGPHLDWGQYQDGVAVNPGEGFLWWTVQGKPPNSNIGGLGAGVYGGTEFTGKQVQNAQELIATAKQIGAGSERELVALLMCAMQESSLKNLKGGDRDSKGYLQQRPSQGWDPSTVRSQVDGFFRGKGTNPGFWDLDRGGELGSTVQAVQKSAHPHEYAKWQNSAIEMVRTLAK
jgi:murein DD-endopeptidase MepM/ murein hydrolase activator NlpD